ncbi:hypothetical protein ACCC88_08130 [Sphingomonas sp. Sphisp140]|uniref:hypothetical protein n=1 Tax=unclassified Sphingomonas TaxID=196159 RepID=UPI0039AFF82F
MAKPRTIVSNARVDLPDDLSAEIGRIIVRWATFEHLLQRIVTRLIGVTDAVARLAVREPRAIDRISLIRDLIELQTVKTDAESFKKFRARAEANGLIRDLLAHGIWFFEDGLWHIMYARGMYPVEDRGTQHPNRRVSPEARIVTLEEAQKVTMEINALLMSAEQLQQSLFSESTSNNISPSR